MELPALLRNLRRPRAKSAVIRQRLRSAVTRNLSLKIFALFLAMLMWGFVASQKRGETTEIKFSTPLVFKNIPASLEVASAPVQSVSVLVRARRARANQVNPGQFQVAIDLSNQLPGSFDYTVTDGNLSYNNVSPPEGMTVLQISPAQIPITLEETIQKVVAIEPKLAGELTPGYKLNRVKMIPDRVKLSGPRTMMGRLESVSTRPLDVQDLRSDVEMLAYLDLPGPVRLAPGQKAFFRAQIDVTGHISRLLLHDVPVQFVHETYAFKASSETINVHLEGPVEAIEALKGKPVTAVLDLAKYSPGDYRGLSPKVDVPDTVRVLKQWPIVNLFVYPRKAE